MATINIHDAKAHLSRLIGRVERGEEFVLARAGEPVARLVPIDRTRARKPGAWTGKVRYGDDLPDPLPAEIAELLHFESAKGPFRQLDRELSGVGARGELDDFRGEARRDDREPSSVGSEHQAGEALRAGRRRGLAGARAGRLPAQPARRPGRERRDRGRRRRARPARARAHGAAAPSRVGSAAARRPRPSDPDRRRRRRGGWPSSTLQVARVDRSRSRPRRLEPRSGRGRGP